MASPDVVAFIEGKQRELRGDTAKAAEYAKGRRPRPVHGRRVLPCLGHVAAAVRTALHAHNGLSSVRTWRHHDDPAH